MSNEYSGNVGAAIRAYRDGLSRGSSGSGASSPAEAYLQTLRMYDEIGQRQRDAQPELSAAVGQLEAGIAAIRGLIRTRELRPSKLNDRIEGLNGCESLALQVTMLRDVVGPSPEQTKSPAE